MKRKILIICICLILLITGCSKKEDMKKKEEPVSLSSDFNINAIKITDNIIKNKNYLISPYSMEIALNMVREGASGTTKEELDKAVLKRDIKDVSIKDKIGIANTIFIKDKYEKIIEKDYKNILTKNYNAEMLLDKFDTPKAINDWTNKKTKGMIKELVKELPDRFVMGLANAIAIDVKWQTTFMCEGTRKEKFNLVSGDTLNTEMMHNTYDYGAKYISNDNMKGVILPYESYNPKTGEVDYEDGKSLEFIAILPNEDISTYINNLTKEELDNIDKDSKVASNKLNIRLGLPRFTYDFDYSEFGVMLNKMGITSMFDINNADFTKIINKDNQYKYLEGNLHINSAIHKTFIDLNETGTKAAAVTAFIFTDSALVEQEEPKIISITFDKPFIYLIRDKESKELLFFGTVYEPNEWKGSTCDEEEQ